MVQWAHYQWQIPSSLYGFLFSFVSLVDTSSKKMEFTAQYMIHLVPTIFVSCKGHIISNFERGFFINHIQFIATTRCPSQPCKNWTLLVVPLRLCRRSSGTEVASQWSCCSCYWWILHRDYRGRWYRVEGRGWGL